jgi:Plasmid stabilisation system protein.
MAKKTYKLRYLPLFYEDLEEKLLYIAEELQNPQAANALLDAVEKAIFERLPDAEKFEKYNSIRERKYPYYRIYVKKFVVYYVVIMDEGNEAIMEVRRFLYEGQNREERL